jgi:dTDP-4-dehydrorhamnose reductase
MVTNKKNLYCSPEVWGGIECTINRVGDAYFDQLQYAGLYQQPHIHALPDLGIKKLRFPILWEKHQPHQNTPIDWTWTEQQLLFLKTHDIDVIAGLVHHGSGPRFTNMLDEAFPELLASYAKKVAQQFPWIDYYTPVNEPLTTARFSGLYGIWYPHSNNDHDFLKMLLHELKGTVLAMQEIRKINPKAKLIQTEDLAKTYSTEALRDQARFENERRWITYDLLCGKVDASHFLWNYFLENDIDPALLRFFQENRCAPDIFGFNYYVTSERYLDEKTYLYPQHTWGSNGRHQYADVEAVRVDIDDETGIEVLLKEAWERYKAPIAVTEVHLHCHREEQVRWFKYVWEACNNLVNEGINIQGVTGWALFGSFGWNRLLTQPGGDYEPGVFDVRGGTARPTALRNFIKEVTSSTYSFHPLSTYKGWWQRECRCIYMPYRENMPAAKKSEKGQPLLIIGKTGTLGKALARICEQRKIPFKLVGRQECDISNLHAIESVLDHYKPWSVINAAGYVRVDDAEQEQAQCFRENYTGPVNLSQVCTRHGIKLVTFSTDLVFDGTKAKPYLESDGTNPLNIYGQSKAQSEAYLLQQNVDALIIRTSAFFGPWDQYNFVQWVLHNLHQELCFSVANDVYISPTYVPDLVHTTLDLLVDEEQGIWHLANQGSITWADFAYETANRFGLDNSFINAIPVQDLSYPAKRPRFSVLGSEKGHLLPPLEDAMQRFFDETHKQLSTVR